MVIIKLLDDKNLIAKSVVVAEEFAPVNIVRRRPSRPGRQHCEVTRAVVWGKEAVYCGISSGRVGTFDKRNSTQKWKPCILK